MVHKLVVKYYFFENSFIHHDTTHFKTDYCS